MDRGIMTNDTIRRTMLAILSGVAASCSGVVLDSLIGNSASAAAPLQSPSKKSENSIRELMGWLALPVAARSPKATVLTLPLDQATAARALRLLVKDKLDENILRRRSEIFAKIIRIDSKSMTWDSRTFGDAPFGKRSLWISLHGGGNAPKEFNDQQWANQIRLYQPTEGIYLAPRAPTDSWNLWHEPHIDAFLQRLIADQVAVNGVDPDKVFILGYSAGGDGVWQLAPRMADRFAAAAMMAGHPGDASLLPLRNLPFGIFMGGADAAYDRNTLAADRAATLDRLAAEDRSGYVHLTRIYPGLPHWMDHKDAEAIPWMATFIRTTWPSRVVWVQDDVPHDRFYWLQLPDHALPKVGDRIVADVVGQTITLRGDVPAGMMLYLSDELVDLDKPVTVLVNGRAIDYKHVPRTIEAMQRSLEDRFDSKAAASAVLVLR